MKYTYYGHIDNSKLHLYNREGFKEILSCFEGKEIALTIGERKTERSNNQNRYYWGVVVPLVRQGLKEAGYGNVMKSEVHKLLKGMFIKDEIVNETTGEILSFVGSTAELSTTAFNEFMEGIAQWAAEQLSLVIPEPNEQMKFEY